MYTQTTAIIRDRWQLTIPDEIRKMLPWVRPESVVSVEVTAKKELIIKPYVQEKKLNWKLIWEGIEQARSIKGKRGNLSQFIIEDRERH
ncbi:MAG: hypothetical protein AAB893_04545 [Patescibacteria group bacterium]